MIILEIKRDFPTDLEVLKYLFKEIVEPSQNLFTYDMSADLELNAEQSQFSRDSAAVYTPSKTTKLNTLLAHIGKSFRIDPQTKTDVFWALITC